jgi:predicted nucleotidyltransferase
MPVRYLNSSVLTWPNQSQVDREVREWIALEAHNHPELRRMGYFGSYARRDWGVGSDLDLVAVIKNTTELFEQRGVRWDLNLLPVPAEILVYTEAEWAKMQSEPSGFFRRLLREVVWIFPGAQ